MLNVAEPHGEIKAQPIVVDPSQPFWRTRAAAYRLMGERRLCRSDRWRAATIATRPGDLTAPDAWRVRALLDKVQS